MAEALTADRLLAELGQLWASLAGGQPAGDEKCVLRACAMTLIVLERDTQPADTSAQILADVMREHPNRAVIVRIRAGTEPLLEHRVTAQCRMPYAGRQQVCCEQIEITVSETSLAGLPPILLPIAAPDLPVVVWCRDAGLLGVAALDAVFRAGKVLVDSCPAADLASHTARGLRIADLSWTGVTRWREIVAQVFEDPARREFAKLLRQVRVLYAGDKLPPAAYYLAAWVIASSGSGKPEARFEKVAPVGENEGICGIVLTAGGHTVSIRLAQGTAVLIEVDSLKSCTVVPRLPETELLSNELAISGRDAVFERMLPVAVGLAKQ